MENILELQQVSKTYPKSDFILDNVTFSLPYGAVLGFGLRYRYERANRRRL